MARNLSPSDATIKAIKQGDLKDALKRPDSRNFPAINDPKRFGELLRAGDAYAATPVVRAALKLAPMLLLRPGELRFGEWVEIDLDAALWTAPAVRMKRELPWALGRRNWLFIGSQLAGERAAVMMSLLHSAKFNGHEPWAYLKDILTRMPTQLNSRIEELLLHRWQPAG